MRIAPRTDCSASRLCGGRRSITGTSKSRCRLCHLECHGCGGVPDRDLSPKFVHRFPPPGGRRVETVWTAPRSVEAADDSDQLSLDPHVVIELRGVGRVRRLQPDAVLLLEEALEGD